MLNFDTPKHLAVNPYLNGRMPFTPWAFFDREVLRALFINKLTYNTSLAKDPFEDPEEED